MSVRRASAGRSARKSGSEELENRCQRFRVHGLVLVVSVCRRASGSTSASACAPAPTQGWLAPPSMTSTGAATPAHLQAGSGPPDIVPSQNAAS